MPAIFISVLMFFFSAEKFMSMTKEEKRKLYKCQDKYVEIKSVLSWPEYYEENKEQLGEDGEWGPYTGSGLTHWPLGDWNEISDK